MVMFSRRLTILIYVVFFGFALCQSEDEDLAVDGNPYVYLVNASDCGSTFSNAALTGFILEGTHGIVTALHGVIGCSEITASNASALGATFIKGLEIIAVDVDHDIALLLPQEDELPSDGLSFTTYEASNKSKWTVIGYPGGAQGQNYVGVTAEGSGRISDLNDLIPSGNFEDAEHRGSPNIHIAKVLTLQNAILPGYSGAPVFDANQDVVGIGNGGIFDGREGWAILWEDVELKEVGDLDVQDKLNNLLTNSSLLMSSLFGIRISQLPTQKIYYLDDVNRDHPYENKEYERCETKLFSPDNGYQFSGAFKIEKNIASAVRGPTVNVLNSGQTLEVYYCIKASSSSVASGIYDGKLDAEIIAEQVPISP